MFKPIGSGGGAGASVSAFIGYTLTIDATTTAPTLGAGTTLVAYYQVLGPKAIQILFSLSQSVAGAAGSGTYIFPPPAGFTIDPAATILNTNISNGVVGAASADSTAGTVKLYSNGPKTGLVISAPTNVGSGSKPLSTASMTYSFSAIVPVI